MISPFPKWCSFLEKFERISKKIVKVLARPASRGSLLQRGAPTSHASEKVGSNKTKSEMILSKEKRKNFKELFYNLNGRPGCTQILAVLTETAIKKSQGISEYTFNIQNSHKKNNSN